MSKENAKKFLRFMAKECGEFSQEDMDAAMKEMQQNSELSEDELNAISGGLQGENDGRCFGNRPIRMSNDGILKNDGKVI